jgi:hypothetical protein
MRYRSSKRSRWLAALSVVLVGSVVLIAMAAAVALTTGLAYPLTSKISSREGTPRGLKRVSL